MLKEKKTKAGIIKAEAANARKEARAEMRKAAAEREKEDKYWKEAGGISKSRGAMKREEAADKRAKAIARRAESRRLEEEETMEIERRLMEKNKKENNGMNFHKIRVVELLVRREEEEVEIKRKAEDDDGKRRRIMSKAEYERMVDVKNTNGESEIVENARTIEAAIQLLAIASLPEPTMTFKAFSDAKMDSLKKNKPGLTDSQRRNKVALAWKKSHLNPANRRKANNNNIPWKRTDKMLIEDSGEEDSSS